MRRAFFYLLAIGTVGCGGPRIPTPPKPARPALAYNRLLFAGDVMLSRGVRRQILAAGDLSLPFRKTAALLASADLTFLNLESPFSDRGPYHEDGLIFHAAPPFINGLTLANIAVASVANNHSRDCGPRGVEFTLKWLAAHGIVPVGSGSSAKQTHLGAVLQRHGIRFGFLAYTYDQSNGNWRDVDDRIALADREVMMRDVADLQKRADVVIVSMHHGIEYRTKPTLQQIAFAHAAIDAGASLVIGHHPHVIQPTETYRNKLIFYSLGNFVFDQFQRIATQHGEIAEVDFVDNHIFFDAVWPVRITRTGPELE